MFYKDIDTLTTYIWCKAGLQQNWEVQEAECTDKLVVFDYHLPCEFAIHSSHKDMSRSRQKQMLWLVNFQGIKLIHIK